MRFFGGGARSGDKKKVSASDLFKKKMQNGGADQPKKTADEQYKEMFENRMAKMMQDYATGNKKGFKLPGTKEDEKPREMSKSAKAMLEILAMKKAQQDQKAAKKKQAAFEREQKAKKRAVEAQKQQKTNAANAAAAANAAWAAQQASYYNNDD